MAGICGIFHFDQQRRVSERDLSRMAARLAHRGTAQTTRILQQNVGLSHNSRSGEAAAYLQASPQRACPAVSVSDSSIYSPPPAAVQGADVAAAVALFPLSSFHENDFSFFARLDGAFALAICDLERITLTLARDRFGVRPLYYYEDAARVIFASEIKAILAVLEEKPSVHLPVLSEYLTFRYVAGSETLFEGIREVLPGHCLVWGRSIRHEIEYWTPEEWLERRASRLDRDRERALDELLEASIRKRIEESPQVGANCSGGIDSGLVTALCSSVRAEPIHTFTVGFEEEAWDERPYARNTAKAYRTRHHELLVRSADFSGELAKLNWHNDEPLSDPNSVLVFLLAQYAGSHVSVLLTGEGADEVFLGYPRYNLLNLYAMARRLPAAVRRSMARLVSLLRAAKMQKLSAILRRPPRDAVVLNSSFVPGEILRRILRHELARLDLGSRYQLVDDLGRFDLLSQLMILEIKTYMRSSLNRLDRMSAASGVVHATPFLDNELFDVALSISNKAKLSLLSNKRPLRTLAAKYLPRENLRLAKSGFGVPIGAWFRSDALMNDALNGLAGDGFMRDVFEEEELRILVEQHMRGEVDHAEILWLVMNLFLWHREYFR